MRSGGDPADFRALHRGILGERLPGMLSERMIEAQLAAELYPIMVEEGHHGVARFGMFQTEIVIGHVCFGPSSIYPTSFDGPGGNFGLGPAAPVLGNREHSLKKGDLVFVDIGCGVEAYHTGKTHYLHVRRIRFQTRRLRPQTVC